MSNRLSHLLSRWAPQKDELQWVLCTIVATRGSSYRKPGAMMLINSLGRYDGLISGGCLEADVMRQARKVMAEQQSLSVTYDMSDEDDIGWQLGIGCGGAVDVLLQPISKQNGYLQLDTLLSKLQQRIPCVYMQRLEHSTPDITLLNEEDFVKLNKQKLPQFGQQLETQDGLWFCQTLKPDPHIAILGGGVDALPLTQIANTLGWQISLSDPRAGYARKEYFPDAHHCYNLSAAELAEQAWLQQVDAIIIMHHNLQLDADFLAAVQDCSARYIGMLGPFHRTERVLELLGCKLEDLPKPLANPVGLDLGGDLPESIALSILAEAHAVLAYRQAGSHSLNLSPELSRKLDASQHRA